MKMKIKTLKEVIVHNKYLRTEFRNNKDFSTHIQNEKKGYINILSHMN